jgi:hypothetical protein
MKWQALLDTSCLIYVNKNLGAYIGSEIQKGTCPIKLQLTGRKGTRNIKPFYTFIGRDTIDALKKYFEEVREGGYPKAGEPIWYSNKHYASGKPRPYDYWSVQKNLLTLSRKLGIVPQKLGNISTRYGKSPHELRDVARSYLHIKGKADGLDSQALEFYMGHMQKLDQLGYDRFYENENYMTEQYKLAERYLNVISTPPRPENGKIEALREEMDTKLEVMKGAILAEAKGNPESESLRRLTKIANAILRGEGTGISKGDIKELQGLVTKLEGLAAYADSGEELNAKYELERYVTEERTKELLTKFYKAGSEPPTTSKVKKLDKSRFLRAPPKK